MYFMQYEITLPADYDMNVIRERVALRGTMTDEFAGLGFKAYLIRERGVDGSTVNQYAPFYVWRDTAGMNRFLWEGGGFQGIVGSFGRQTVSTWSGIRALRGPACEQTPRFATRERRSISFEADLQTVAREALAEQEHIASLQGVHSAYVAIDPRHWEIVFFTLRAQGAIDAIAGERYEIRHLSSPALEALLTPARGI